jgi:hypothetical protein
MQPGFPPFGMTGCVALSGCRRQAMQINGRTRHSQIRAHRPTVLAPVYPRRAGARARARVFARFHTPRRCTRTRTRFRAFSPRCLETRMPMASSETAARTTSRGRLQARTPLRSAPAWIAHALASVRMRALKNLLPSEDAHGCVGACSRRARVRASVHLPSPDENGSRASGSLRLIDERCEGPDGSPLRVFACLLGGFFFWLACLFVSRRAFAAARLFLFPLRSFPSVRDFIRCCACCAGD